MAQFFSQLDASWLSERLKQSVVSFTLDEVDQAKLNYTSCLRFATVELADGSVLALVIKMAAAAQMSQTLGLAREAYFYSHWRELETVDGASCELDLVLPRVFHAEGMMETGSKIIVMEDLSATSVQLGYLFGSGNPNNWDKDLAALSAGKANVSEATRLAFSAAAKLHAPYWCQSLLVGNASLSWLRGTQWLAGQDASGWKAAQANVARLWDEVKAKIADGAAIDYKVQWDPLLVACLDAAISKAAGDGGWERYQAELQARPFTLVHGDFHPANLLYKEDDGQVLLVDWEAVGLGSGPQELGQFMISHTEPNLRAALEKQAVEDYYSELTALNPQVAMTLEQCWQEYVAGGLGRWLFFLPYDGWGAPPAVSQYFCNQCLAFIKDHGVTPESVPMPRM